MSNIFQTVMGKIGSSIGAGVTSTLDTAIGYLPSSAQSFLGSVGSFTNITTQDIGDFVAGAFTTELNPTTGLPYPKTTLRDLPQPGAIRGVGPSGAKPLAGAGQAQMIPFGNSDRIARAIQDQRVSQKLIQMSQGFRPPSPNIRSAPTITLSSASSPSASLTRKYTTKKVKA